MKPKVHIETSVASYLTARTSRDLVVAAHQELTLEWWVESRMRFGEASKGDPSAASKPAALNRR